MTDLVLFCEDYNAIRYGEAEIIELSDKIIIRLYNSGFSENEEMDDKFREKYKKFIILDRHPIIIAEFSKLPLFFYHITGYENLKDRCDCHTQKKKFIHKLELD